MMVTHEGDVRAGMDVVGLDGMPVGTVSEVWIEKGTRATPHDLSTGMPPASDTERAGYFRVDDGTAELYVPFEAIVIMFPGQNVTIGSTVEECRQRYGVRPSALSSCRLVRATTARRAPAVG